MHLITTKVIKISRAKFHCSRLTTVQDVQDCASLIFWHTVYVCHVSLLYVCFTCEFIIVLCGSLISLFITLYTTVYL